MKQKSEETSDTSFAKGGWPSKTKTPKFHDLDAYGNNSGWFTPIEDFAFSGQTAMQIGKFSKL